jgi:hypothetical protein
MTWLLANLYIATEVSTAAEELTAEYADGAEFFLSALSAASAVIKSGLAGTLAFPFQGILIGPGTTR